MQRFGKAILDFLSSYIFAVVLLAAAMSTLDGLLVSLSTITANDLVLNLLPRRYYDTLDEAARMRFALRASHVVLIVIAVAAYLINLQPPRLLGVFGQVGVYGLAVAATPPLLAGVLTRRPPVAAAWTASIVALVVHFGLYARGSAWFPGSSLSFANPGVTASIAALVTVPTLLLITRVAGRTD